MGKLTVMAINKSLPAGRYGDGNGLYLLVGPGGGKSWVFRFKVNGRERAMGLGPYPLVSLAEAREKALEHRITLTCQPKTQLIWMRWEFPDGPHEVLDLWQFGRFQEVLLTTQYEGVPAWARGDRPSCIKRQAAVWRLMTGDRVAYTSSFEFEGKEEQVVVVYEADADALVAFSDEDARFPFSELDESQSALAQGRAAVAAVKNFGPPRSMKVDTVWELGA